MIEGGEWCHPIAVSEAKTSASRPYVKFLNELYYQGLSTYNHDKAVNDTLDAMGICEVLPNNVKEFEARQAVTQLEQVCTYMHKAHLSFGLIFTNEVRQLQCIEYLCMHRVVSCHSYEACKAAHHASRMCR